MADETEELHTEEVEAFHREQALAEMEAQLHHQEQGIIEMERAFLKRTAALRNLVSYLADQERALLDRAEAIGPRARALVSGLVERESADEVMKEVDFGMTDEREVMLERRQELMDTRMALVEEREELYERRHGVLDEAEGRVAEIEERLLSRELEISQALRKLITSASDLSGPAEEDELLEGLGGEGASRPKRQDSHTTQVRFNLQARMAGDEDHHFFRYEANGEEPGDLPGLFIATSNLLKEDREVEVDIDLDDEDTVRAKGVVAWRRKPGDGDDPAGMGIELTWVEDGGRDKLDAWLSEHPPEVLHGGRG
ncbi:MAG: hypothetical protein ACQEXJ_00980 [Myxococcota bacterium]